MAERVLDVVPGLIKGHKSDGRCVYDAAAKRELVRRCHQPGISVAAMALAHGINANLLRSWITKVARREGRGVGGAAALVPVTTAATAMVSSPSKTPSSSPKSRSGESTVELELPSGTVRVRGVEAAEVLRALIDGLLRRA
jgi:transposase-like protein